MLEVFLNVFISFLITYVIHLYGNYRYLRGRIDLLEEMTMDEMEREKLSDK